MAEPLWSDGLLPAAGWTRRADLGRLITALGQGPDGESAARYVGGAVRDTLLGLDVQDIDMATVLLPPQVITRLAAAGISTIPTGIAHGTVTAVLPQGPVEITTLRHDLSTDGRHATIAFTGQWHEDAVRRDFTINALYACPVSRVIHDHVGGLEDLAHHRVRFIGDPQQRILEDHLRILRYFRFRARYGAGPADAASEAACGNLAPMLKGLSRERIGMEVTKLLALPDPAPTVIRMAELGVLAVILPEADPAPLARLIKAEVHSSTAPEPIRRLAALLPADPALAEQVAARLRLSTLRRKRLVTAAARGEDAPDTLENQARTLAWRLGLEEARDRLLLAGAGTDALKGWQVPPFPLKGGVIVARGIKAGPEVARLLHAVETRWVQEGFPDAARVLALLEDALAS